MLASGFPASVSRSCRRNKQTSFRIRRCEAASGEPTRSHASSTKSDGGRVPFEKPSTAISSGSGHRNNLSSRRGKQAEALADPSDHRPRSGIALQVVLYEEPGLLTLLEWGCP